LVEDDAAVRALLGRVLRAQGYAVLEAEHGLDALDIAVRRGVGSIDLLLTDMVVPHMDGHELAERLRLNFPRIRLLFMSGYVDKAAASTEQPQHNAAFIQKPFTATALVHKVRQALDG
jgi:CheY-like chemotaxis protein